MQFDWPRTFSYITWERDFSKNLLKNHEDKDGASHKPQNSTSMEQIFCQFQKAITFKDISSFFPTLFFSWQYHIFILKKPKICMKFHKNSVNCFWEKVPLINWLTDLQWRFHKQGFKYWGDGGSPPHQPKICSPPHLPGLSLLGGWGESPPPAKICLFPTPLNNNFQVITQSKQHF